MGVKIVGIDELTTLLDRTADDTNRHMAEMLRREANEIARLAGEFSPVDTESLENSWEVVELGGDRDYRGRFTKKSYAVQIDPTARNPDGTWVSDYALEMHEHQEPYGSGRYKLGKKSQKKNEGNGRVGGKFLERAVDEVEYELMARMQKVVRSHY